MAHITKKEKKQFDPLIDAFEEAAAKTDFLPLTRPYLYDNLVFLYDNPERLCQHYVDLWQDLSVPFTLEEERAHTGAFTDAVLADCWRQITSSLRRVFYIGK